MPGGGRGRERGTEEEGAVREKSRGGATPLSLKTPRSEKEKTPQCVSLPCAASEACECACLFPGASEDRRHRANPQKRGSKGEEQRGERATKGNGEGKTRMLSSEESAIIIARGRHFQVAGSAPTFFERQPRGFGSTRGTRSRRETYLERRKREGERFGERQRGARGRRERNEKPRGSLSCRPRKPKNIFRSFTHEEKKKK